MNTDEELIDIYHLSKMNETIGNVHESVYKSYNVLKHVERMLKRGDSNETILELIQYTYRHKTLKDY